MSDSLSIASLDTPRVQPPKPPAAQADAAEGAPRRGLFGPEGFKFSDFLDIINPLQHIPIVSTIYRAVTGDKIEAGARIAGGGLFGGPIGLVASVFSAVVAEATGRDPGEHALALAGFESNTDPSEPAAVATAMAKAPATDRLPPELVAALQPQPAQPPRNEFRLGARIADPDAQQPTSTRQDRRAEQPVQASSVPAAVAQAPAIDEAAMLIAARARPLEPGARPAVQPPALQAPARDADGRMWFPVTPQGGAAPVRGVGTQPVTQQNVAVKFGAARGAAAHATMLQGEAGQAEWANRATEAYQKYFEMQKRERQREVDTRQ